MKKGRANICHERKLFEVTEISHQGSPHALQLCIWHRKGG